jgi:antitoxin VapB
METTRVFTNGRSQAVRIPRQYRFDVDEVYINKVGDVLMLTPKASLAAAFDAGAAVLTEDFLADGIPDSVPSRRDEM